MALIVDWHTRELHRDWADEAASAVASQGNIWAIARWPSLWVSCR